MVCKVSLVGELVGGILGLASATFDLEIREQRTLRPESKLASAVIGVAVSDWLHRAGLSTYKQMR